MKLTVATWNINSVRLRFEQVARFCREHQPDVLCLQETKCIDDLFPRKETLKLGYDHIAIHGQKSYNGVAILSKLPFADVTRQNFCGLEDRRHISVKLSKEAGAAKDLLIHNFYIPAGGDIPDPETNKKFAHKLKFLDELTQWSDGRKPEERSIAVGDLNVAPCENDVWSHRQLLDIVSHTPIETGKMKDALAAGQWIDTMRALRPEPEKLFSWWSYRAQDWKLSNRGRRLDHIWLSPSLKDSLASGAIVNVTRDWERPSDHVPVVATLEL